MHSRLQNWFYRPKVYSHCRHPTWTYLKIFVFDAKNQIAISSNQIRTSKGFFVLLEGENAGKGGGWYKDWGKCIKESRIKFPDPMLMTLDTPHGRITKFLKKCPKNVGKMRRKQFFSPFWYLRNQREISKNEVRRPPPFVWKYGHSPSHFTFYPLSSFLFLHFLRLNA